MHCRSLIALAFVLFGCGTANRPKDSTVRVSQPVVSETQPQPVVGHSTEPSEPARTPMTTEELRAWLERVEKNFENNPELAKWLDDKAFEFDALGKDTDRWLKRVSQGFNEIAAPKQPTGPVPYVGFVGMFQTDVATNIDDMRRFDRLNLAEDQYGIEQMGREGKVRWFRGKARVIRVIPPVTRTSTLYYCELRIMETPDEVVWASMSRLPTQ